MKRHLIIYGFVGFLLSLQATFAQISQHGTPVSFISKGMILQKNIPTRSMAAIDVQKLLLEDIVNDRNKEIPWRFGQNIPVNIDIKSGVCDVLSSGDRLWRLRIYSQGAFSLNFNFDNYNLPRGAKLFLYNESKTRCYGAFTEFNNQQDKNFATTLLEGESIIFEYFEPKNAPFEGMLHLSRVTHGYRNVLDFTAKNFGTSGACNNNVKCPIGAGWEDQVRSVCMLVTGGSGFCTGALVNNTANDGTPYVLTANHCSTSNDFASWIFWFNWESATCQNPTSNPTHDQATTSGCVLKARNAGSDFCLVQMNQPPPTNFNVYYSGWSSDPTAATSLVCIHHPDGDIKKLSTAGAATSITYSSAQCWNAPWISGVTEPGSSGSPLFDQNHRVVGQLYGGPSACGASASNLNDNFGKFAISWNTGTTPSTRLKDWLDPGNTGVVIIDGYDPNTPSANLDAQALMIINVNNSYCGAATFIPGLIIKNRGTHILTSLLVQYDLDGTQPISANWIGSLASNSIDTVWFAQASTGIGSHILTAYVSIPNDSADSNTTNDTITYSFSVTNGSTLPFTEGFEGVFPPQSWIIDNPDGSTSWASASITNSGITGSTKSAFMDYYGYDAAGQLDGLITPMINLSSATNATLTFMVAYRRYDNTSNDGLKIYVSSDCGQTFDTAIYYKSGTTLANSTTNSTQAYTPSAANQWKTETVSLTQYVGNAIKVKFEGICDYGNNMYLDQINIDQATGIDAILSDFSYSIYPNPASRSLTIAANKTGIIKVEIYDILGKCVYNNSHPAMSYNIGLFNFSNGIYYVKLYTKDKTISEKVVVTK